MSWIYDSHIHLSDPEYKSDIDMILNYMDLLKIKACCVSMDIETSNETMNLHQKSKNVLPFIGIHPEMAQKESEPVYDLIEKNNHSELIQQKYAFFLENSMLSDCYFYLGYVNKENFVKIKDNLNKEQDLIHILKIAFDIEVDSNLLQQQAEIIQTTSNAVLEIVSNA